MLRLSLLVSLLAPLAVIAPLAAACGRQVAAPSALTELRRVAGVKPGTPVLVFVYTDR